MIRNKQRCRVCKIPRETAKESSICRKRLLKSKKDIHTAKRDKKRKHFRKKRENVAVYMVHCTDDLIYVGITNNINRRMKQHQGILNGGAKFTKEHGFKRLVGYIWFPSREVALTEERRLTALTETQKKDFIKLNFEVNL